MKNPFTLSVVVFGCLLARNSFVCALSSPQPEIVRRGFIQLTNPIDTLLEQSIPTSFVSDWPTWVLDEDGILSKIPDDDGFVPPASIDEVWQPMDLKRPELRLALGIHVYVCIRRVLENNALVLLETHHYLSSSQSWGSHPASHASCRLEL
jgi:hypothetical protein